MLFLVNLKSHMNGSGVRHTYLWLLSVTKISGSRVKVSGNDLGYCTLELSQLHLLSATHIPANPVQTQRIISHNQQWEAFADLPPLSQMVNCRKPSSQVIRLFISRGDCHPEANISGSSRHSRHHSQGLIDRPLCS